MIEYILWATNPLTNERRPISEKVFDKQENERRATIAKQNGWTDIVTQTINWSQDEANVTNNFVKAINKK